MKSEHYKIWFWVAFGSAACFALMLAFTILYTKSVSIQFKGVREIKGKEVELYGIKGFEDMFISVPKQPSSGEIVVMNAREAAAVVKIALSGGSIQDVIVMNSAEDYVIINRSAEAGRFTSLKRVTPASETALRVQLDSNLDGVMDQEASIER